MNEVYQYLSKVVPPESQFGQEPDIYNKDKATGIVVHLYNPSIPSPTLTPSPTPSSAMTQTPMPKPTQLPILDDVTRPKSQWKTAALGVGATAAIGVGIYLLAESSDEGSEEKPSFTGTFKTEPHPVLDSDGDMYETYAVFDLVQDNTTISGTYTYHIIACCNVTVAVSVSGTVEENSAYLTLEAGESRCDCEDVNRFWHWSVPASTGSITFFDNGRGFHFEGYNNVHDGDEFIRQ